MTLNICEVCGDHAHAFATGRTIYGAQIRLCTACAERTRRQSRAYPLSEAKAGEVEGRAICRTCWQAGHQDRQIKMARATDCKVSLEGGGQCCCSCEAHVIDPFRVLSYTRCGVSITLRRCEHRGD